MIIVSNRNCFHGMCAAYMTTTAIKRQIAKCVELHSSLDRTIVYETPQVCRWILYQKRAKIKIATGEILSAN